MKKLIDEAAARWRFLQTGWKRWDTNANFVPSSRFLVDAMLGFAPMADARCVVELGPGIGTVTRPILGAMRGDAHLHAIEIDADLLATTAQSISDPRLRPLHGSAEHIRELMAKDGCAGRADVVFSSLGLSLMPELRDAVMRSVIDAIGDDGVFVQYAYVHARVIAYSVANGWFRWDARPFLAKHFADVRTKLVVANVPPALVFACRKGRADGDARP